MKFKSRLGFTLIELVIVVLIVSIIIGVVYGLPSRIDAQRDSLEMRQNVQAAGARAFDLWRHDALVAEEAALATDGAAMTITRRNEQDETYTVTYELDDGRLLRRSSSTDEPRSTVLCASATDLAFTNHERLWEMRWRAVLHDGKQEWSWPQQGFAAPLFAGALNAGPLFVEDRK
jgi:prepilin-type N-terminal cleavage/methylation domain-containing protein